MKHPHPTPKKSSLQEYYERENPNGKPFRMLDNEELRVVRRQRRAFRWKNLKMTAGDIISVVRFFRGFLK